MTRNCRLALALSVLTLPALGSPPPAAPRIADLAFLAGSWATDAGPTRIEEQWLCPAPDTMIGMGRTVSVAKGKTVFFEYLRIETRADGLVYVAQPKGGPATEFRLVRLEAGTAIFENLAHDFPKRVTYTKGSGGGLTARVEGDARSTEKAEEIRYRSAAAGCR
ncbi:MAG TPA: DUF6265 family protein [Thermoanaerobaculia bacterium]|nr:DUF6265 family protein [Thermoanaerobaculia bacterium]